MEEQNKATSSGLFREKSLEAIESPESLNDYLRVTSPQVWLVLAAVIVLLVGGILWGIFGRIDTRQDAAVITQDGITVCYVPVGSADEIEPILKRNEVTVDGKTYGYRLAEGGDVEIGFLAQFVDEKMITRASFVGKLSADATVIAVPVDAAFEDGIRTGVVTTETLNPIALLLQ